MRTGRVAQMIGDLLLIFVYFSGILSFLGQLRNSSLWFFVPVQKPNTEVLPLLGRIYLVTILTGGTWLSVSIPSSSLV